MRKSRRGALVAGAAVAVLTGIALSTGISGRFTVHPAQAESSRHHGDHEGDQGDHNVQGPVALPGYTISLFARGTDVGHTHPDPIVYDPEHIFVAYQDGSNATGGTPGVGGPATSTIVEYTDDGSVVKSFTPTDPGRIDGMRVEPSTGLLWATFNEDGNSFLETLAPKTGTWTKYAFPPDPQPHQGGYDDLAFLPGQPTGTAFIAASNPQLNPNTAPAVVAVTLNTTTQKASLTTVLDGSAMVPDITSGATSPVMLNLQDPDSLAIDASGDVDPGVDLVLVDQADSKLVFIQNALGVLPGGSGSPTAKVLDAGDQLEDTVWPPSESGRLFIVDGANAIYTIRGEISPNAVYTEAPSDSGVAGFVGTVAKSGGTLNGSTGIITPIAIGFGSPTGLLFVPDSR
jgi:hypothetical protein